MNIQRPLLLAAALSSVLLAACAAPSTSADKGSDMSKPKVDATIKNDAAPAARINLRGFTWNLDSAVDAAGKPIALLQREGKYGLKLSFVGDNLGVSGGCNHVGAGFKLDGDRLDIGDFRTTLMACQDQRLMQMDTAISEQLKGKASYAIEGEPPSPRLLLTTASGAKLTLSGEPTAETRYGSAGTTMFLEVDSQLRKCSHPLIPNHQCLWVRERTYDANGVALKPSDEWHFLYQDIEGYQHEAGIRNVVRVKKFDVKNPPADASSVAYVLDMVVESESVPAPNAK
jgi:heat shock protein HslJ